MNLNKIAVAIAKKVFLMENDGNLSDLEKIATKDKSLVDCKNKKCVVRGDYYKCYFGKFPKCSIYQAYQESLKNLVIQLKRRKKYFR